MLGNDLHELNLDEENIELLITHDSTSTIVTPFLQHPTTYCKTLSKNHRNSWQICSFLGHLCSFMDALRFGVPKKHLSLDVKVASQESPVIWIMAKDDLSDEEILNTIKKDHNIPNDGTVTIIFGKDVHPNRLESLAHCCKVFGWNCVREGDMSGSESLIIITIEIKDYLETCATARKQLMIVTR